MAEELQFQAQNELSFWDFEVKSHVIYTQREALKQFFCVFGNSQKDFADVVQGVTE